MSDHIGQIFGNYRLIHMLGRGASAEVYLGEHRYLKTQAAVKVLRGSLEAEDVECFTKEAQTVAALKHPHILRVLDFGFEGSDVFLAMEYAPHGTMRNLHPRGSIIPLADVVGYVRQIASALHYAHTQARIIHRDVKPENLLIADDRSIRLGDFGLAMIVPDTTSLRNMDRSGTPCYMAPEQIEQKPCPASDQYALAVVVYEWLCGQRPFTGDNFVAIYMQHLTASVPSLCARNSRIPQQVEQVILTALSRDPHQRFADVQVFADALAQASQLAETTPGFSNNSLTDIPTLVVNGAQGPLNATEVALRIPSPENNLSAAVPFPLSPIFDDTDSEPAPFSQQTSTPASTHLDRPAPLVPWFRRKAVLLPLLALLLVSGTLYYSLNLFYASRAHSLANTTHTAPSGKATTTSTPKTTTSGSSTPTPTTTISIPIPNSSTPPSGGSTPVPSPAPTHAPASPIPAGWQKAFDDPLTESGGSNPDPPWESDSSCNFTGSYYEESVTGSNYCARGDSTSNSFSDLAYSLDLAIHQGSRGGLVVRKANNNYYYFAITISGGYALFLHTSANGGNDTPIVSGNAGAIHQGLDQWNTLLLLIQGNTFKLYINNQYITSAQDGSLSSGAIAVAANGPDSQSVTGDTRFKNAIVWIP